MRFFFAGIITFALFGSAAALASEPDHGAALFAERIRPVLQDKCIRCHNPKKHKGQLDLTHFDGALKGSENGPVLVPGKSADSKLYEMVKTGKMPPNDPQPKVVTQAFQSWIDAGASYGKATLKPPVKKHAGLDWWSLQPLADGEPPTPNDIPESWTHSVIDRFIFAKLNEKKLQPSPPADRKTLIRRATYDLTGLPPRPEDVDAFIHDTRPDAYERLIDRLLASPHYGEHWGRHWLDVIRFGESIGFERNVIINNAWPFRDYIIRSFNDDKPFDQLVLEHLAGDVIGPGNPEVEVGTTFLVCGPYDDVGNQDPAQAAQIRANTIDDIIRATGETFLGLTVGCGRCHDHKFDPITQQDYYGLYSTFAGIRHGNRVMATDAEKKARAATLKPLTAAKDQLVKQKTDLDNAIFARAETKAAEYEARWTRPPIKRTGVEETFPPVEARFVRLMVEGQDNNPKERTGYRIDEFEIWTADPKPRNVAAATAGAKADGKSHNPVDFPDAYNVKLAIDGMFGAQWFAHGPDLTITLAKPETIRRVFFSSDRGGDAGDHYVATFVTEYHIEVSLDGKKWTEVANSYDRKPVKPAHRRKRFMDFETTPDEKKQFADLNAAISKAQQKISSIKPLPSWWTGKITKADGPFHIFVGGSPQRKGVQAVPVSMSALSKVTKPYKLPAEAPESERRLTLAKWIVAPDNPLTPRVLANRLWHYHFGTGIVATPSDFGFMGGRPTHPELLDWLARQIHANGWHLKPLHKLIMLSQTYQQASTYRADAAKTDAASRFLWRFPPRRLAGEEIRDTILAIAEQLDERMGGPGFRLYQYIQDNVATYVPRDHHGPETYRRAVYHQNARASRVDLMTDFDCPDNAFGVPRRASTTTPLQALTMMNHSFTMDMADRLAERFQRDAGPNDHPAQVRAAFALAYTRPPKKEELDAAVRLIETHGLRAFCRALLNSSELIYVN